MVSFALVMSITPGPVNLMTLYSGATNGVRRTIPFVFGATVGFTVLLLVIGLGVGKLISNIPYLEMILKGLGTIFLLYLAVKIFTDTGAIQQQNTSAPSLLSGALLQWLNPKAWAACVSGVALFTTSRDPMTLYVFSSIYFGVCLFAVGAWAVMGAQIQILLNTPNALRGFNRVMGSGLAAIAVFMYFT